MNASKAAKRCCSFPKLIMFAGTQDSNIPNDTIWFAQAKDNAAETNKETTANNENADSFLFNPANNKITALKKVTNKAIMTSPPLLQKPTDQFVQYCCARYLLSIAA